MKPNPEITAEAIRLFAIAENLPHDTRDRMELCAIFFGSVAEKERDSFHRLAAESNERKAKQLFALTVSKFVPGLFVTPTFQGIATPSDRKRQADKLTFWRWYGVGMTVVALVFLWLACR